MRDDLHRWARPWHQRHHEWKTCFARNVFLTISFLAGLARPVQAIETVRIDAAGARHGSSSTDGPCERGCSGERRDRGRWRWARQPR